MALIRQTARVNLSADVTALCSGGASQLKAGMGSKIVMSGTVLAGLVEIALGPWALPLSALIAAKTWDLTSLCATDPPAIPVFSDQDWISLALFATNPVDSLPALSKFSQLIDHYAWYQFCECASVATPAPVAFAQPLALPSQNPQVVSPLVTLPCLDVTIGVNMANVTSTQGAQANSEVSPQILGQFPSIAIPVAQRPTPSTATAYKLPTPLPVSVTAKMTNISDGSLAQNTGDIWAFYDASGNQITNSGITATQAGSLHTGTLAIPATAVYATCTFSSSQTATPVQRFTYEAILNCSSANQPQTPCCPPDPYTNQLLQNIAAQVQTILKSIPIIASSLAESTVHAGLSGNGDFAIATNLAVRVALTTIPNALGLRVADPTFYFSAGWVRGITAEGATESVPVTSSSQLVHLDPFATRLGYTFAPGVIATITELVRGP